MLVLLPLSAGETRVVVKVKAKDAKFVGSSMGGVLVTIKDVHSGELLAKGLTEGSTGDTDRIMSEPKTRHGVYSSEGSAAYTAVLNIDEPVFVKIEAWGPRGQSQSATSASVSQWILPDKHIEKGDAVLLDLPGFLVDILSPAAHQFAEKGTIEIEANLVMMCGCPTKPEGLWDSNRFEIEAVIQKGEWRKVVPMMFTGQTSRFKASVDLEAGTYVIMVTAFDPENGNTGLDRTSIILHD